MVNKYKTIKGLLNAFSKLEKHPYSDLKGYEKLTYEQKESIGCMCGALGNELGEFFPEYHSSNKLKNSKT